MAIEFNWTGYEYQEGLRTLKKSYERAMDNLQNDVDQSYHDIHMYDGRLAGQIDPDFQVNDEGAVLHDPRDSLIYASLAAEQAIQALRKAYAIMLYHHWERGARDWSKKDHGGFPVIAKAVQDIGVYVEQDMIDMLMLVNALKHNADIWGQPLYDMRPEWFPNEFRRERKRIEWFEEIQIDAKLMEYLFSIVSRSGPNEATVNLTSI